jgi:transcriptional regulator with XRE-family HTH domain
MSKTPTVPQDRPPRETLGERLQRLRAGLGLTQQQVADAAGVPLTTLRGWEVDRREPGFRAACRLAGALGVTVETLADTATVEEVGKKPRPAGATKPPAAGAKGKSRGKK